MTDKQTKVEVVQQPLDVKTVVDAVLAATTEINKQVEARVDATAKELNARAALWQDKEAQALAVKLEKQYKAENDQLRKERDEAVSKAEKSVKEKVSKLEEQVKYLKEDLEEANDELREAKFDSTLYDLQSLLGSLETRFSGWRDGDKRKILQAAYAIVKQYREDN